MTTLYNPVRSEHPRIHLSGGRSLIAERYVIGWDAGIVKVGTTWNGSRRWGQFLSRGGLMLDRATYDDLGQSRIAEAWLRREIGKNYASAFSDKSDAEPYLGSRGAGYLDCYRVPTSDWPEIVDLARTVM